MQSYVLTKKEVEDFYEIYKGIPNADYSGMVRQGSSGRCIVLALSKGSIQLTESCSSVVEAFRCVEKYKSRVKKVKVLKKGG